MIRKSEFTVVSILLIIFIFCNIAISKDFVVPKNEKLAALKTGPFFSLSLSKLHWDHFPEELKSDGFGIQFYSKNKEEIKDGACFLVTLDKENFFQFLPEFENDFKEILGDKYQETIDRFERGENFYFFEKGSITRLILCSQNNKDMAFTP